MLPILHSAANLFREDAFRVYCNNVDVWGAYQPASFIFGCFEALRDAAAQESLLLVAPFTPGSGNRQWFPSRAEREWHARKFDKCYGLVCSLDDRDSANQVLTFLENDANVIGMLPNEFISIHCSHVDGAVEKALREPAACLDRLGLCIFKERLSGKSPGKEVWWEEVPRPTGRLFITCDAFLSDGFFLDGYGRTEASAARITTLLRQFAVRKRPLLLATADSFGSHWPCHEPFTLTLRLKNFGPPLKDAMLSVLLDESCEPTTATEVILPRMDSLAEVTVAFQFVPRVGKCLAPIGQITAQASGQGIDVSSAIHPLHIVASLKTLISAQGAADDADYSRLAAIIARTPQLAELRNFAQLARVDVEACLNKLRKAAEKLALRALSTVSVAPAVRDFNGAIRALQDHRVLSGKAVGYLHTIRVIGNLASHPSGETLTTDDVRVAAFALASVVEEMLDRRVI